MDTKQSQPNHKQSRHISSGSGKPVSTYVAYVALAAALAVWVGVVCFALLIQKRYAAYLDHIVEVSRQTTLAADAARLHILASGNVERSSKLDAIMSPDVPSIVETIKSVGTATGIPVKISGALPTSVPKNQADTQAVAFILESSGSFNDMMSVLSLFESLPLPSSVEVVDLSRGEKGESATRKPPQWRLNLKLRVITTADISS